jgi:hypothetical protein
VLVPTEVKKMDGVMMPQTWMVMNPLFCSQFLNLLQNVQNVHPVKHISSGQQLMEEQA